MQYMFLIYLDEAQMAATPKEDITKMMPAYFAYTEAMMKAGVLVGGDQLAPTATATTVRLAADGKTKVLNGPYAETREQLGGYYIVDVPDLDAALSWAARCPGAARGIIEVRPLIGVQKPKV